MEYASIIKLFHDTSYILINILKTKNRESAVGRVVVDVNLTVGGVQEKLKFSRDGPVLVLEGPNTIILVSMSQESQSSELSIKMPSLLVRVSHKGPTYVYVSIHKTCPYLKSEEFENF
jgi:hypothetical protein